VVGAICPMDVVVSLFIIKICGGCKAMLGSGYSCVTYSSG